ncbi:MAG TPA: hypothetical protein VGC76_05010 [Pyrinomonadaceae bacterium]|jgi:hypothetical protein
MNQFINQPVVNWARQNLPQAVEVKLKGNSLFARILLGFCFAFLALIFLGIPLLFFYSAITAFLANGWSQKVSGGLFGGTIFLVIFGLFALVIFFLLKFTRRKFAKFISSAGVETRGGQKYGWEKLHFLNYKKVNTKINSHQLAISMVRAAILAGVEKVTVEMVFENGTAVVPPLLENQPEILALLNSMPVQRRDEGTVRQ